MGSVSFVVECPDVTIPGGQQASQAIASKDVYDDAAQIMLYGPAALDAHTFVIEVSRDGTTWAVLEEGNPSTPVPPPGIDEARAYTSICAAAYFRIFDQTGAVGANRSWKMTKQITL